jgi:hypothetical protein
MLLGPRFPPYSNGQWHETSGARSSRQKEQSWERTDPESYNVINHIPTPRVMNHEEFAVHLEYYHQHQETATRFYRQRQFRQLKVRNRAMRARAYTTIARTLFRAHLPRPPGVRPRNTLNVGSLRGPLPRPVVFYGGAGFNPSSRGFPSTPRLRLFHELSRYSHAVQVGERLTSQLCSNCGSLLVKTPFKSSLRCIVCKETWNRDTNAARNIRAEGIERNNNGGVRGVAFFNPVSDPPR